MFTIHHFEEENYNPRTIRRIIDRYTNGISVERKSGSGRIAKKMPKPKIKMLKEYFDNKDGISQRIAAKKFKISQSYVNFLLKNKTSIK